MKKTLIVAAVLASSLAATAAAAPSATGHGQPGAAPAASPDGVCAGNTGTDTFNAVVSQNFEATFAAYSSQAADDFILTKTCIASDFHVTGQYFNGSGPADSVDLTYYKNKNGHPGRVIKSFAGLPYTNGPSFNLVYPKFKLKPGHYWVSPVANMNFSSGGEWGWEVQSEINGSEAVWVNPGGGFGVCSTWDTLTNCLGITGDFLFTVTGKLKG